MPEEKNSSSNEGKEQKADKAPESSSSGKAQEGSTEAPLKFKSHEEAERSYKELERKLGEHSKEVEEARKLKDQTEVMLKAIWSDPDTYRQVESAINKFVSGEELPDTRKPDKKGGEGAKGTSVSPEMADLRKAEENRILGEFNRELGYDSLPDKERQEKFTQTAVVLAELLDPSGKKSVKEIVNSISLDKLPKYLRYAHRVAHTQEIAEQAKRSALISNEENRAASIGSFAASSGKTGSGVTLTNREREVARKMHISEEDYLKQKVKIQSELKEQE